MYGVVSLIEVRGDTLIRMCSVGWGRIGQVVCEIGGEVCWMECNLGYF